MSCGRFFRRFLSIFLALTLCIGCLPLATIAEEVNDSPVVVANELPEGAIVEVRQKTEEPKAEVTTDSTQETTTTSAEQEPAVQSVDVSVVAVPVAEEPQVEEPKTEEPQVEESKAEEPQVEEPKAEEPQVEESKVEEPQAEEPQVEEPQAEEPKTEEPQEDPNSGKFAVVVTIESGNTYTEYYSEGEVVTLTVPSKDHYTFLGWESADVSVVANKFTMPAKTVNVSAKWDPEVHTVTIYYVSTTGGGNMPVASVSDIEYGHSFELADKYEIPKVDGFTAFKVTHGSEELTDISKYREFIKVDSVENNERFYVYYEPAEVQYTVKRYMELLDGTYSETPDETITNYAKYGDKISAKTFVQNYTGFSWDQNDATIILSSDAENNVIRLYYTRNSYNLNYQTTDDTETQRLKYGEPIDINSLGVPTRVGYTFSGWKTAAGAQISEGYTMPAHDVTLFADWTPAMVNYTIRYWQENLASANNLTEIEGYDYIEAGTAQALAGSKISGTDSTSFTGFEFDHADTDVTVKADGSTVVNVYYRRSWYKYEFYSNNGRELLQTLNYKYGANLAKDPYEWPSTDNQRWRTGTNNSGSSYGCPRLAIEAKDVKLYKEPTEKTTYLYGWYEDGTCVVLNTWAGEPGGWTSSQRYTPDGYTAYEYGTDTVIAESGGVKIEATTIGEKYGYHVTLRKNTYVLTLNNGESDFASHNYLYGESIENALADMNVSEITPPAAYADYNFAGWTYKLQSYSLEGKTMPDYNMVLVATWEIPVYTVNFYDDNTMTNLVYTEDVERGGTVLNDPDEPTRENYEFVGWYYMDGEVEKLYFDGKPINRNFDIYAKWVNIDSNQVDIVVKHEYYEADGTTLINSETETIQATVGTTVTVYSKTVTGFYPELLSQNVEAKENQVNEAVFKYLKLDGVQYTVHYVDQDGNKLIADKVEVTSKMDIVEVYEYIAGATPRTISQSLRLTANPEQNVITFVYDVEGTNFYVVKHYLENLDGTYSLQETETIENIRYYTEVTATPKTYEGFEYDANMSTPNGRVLPNKSLVLSMYYNRIEYTVTYVYKGVVPEGVAELPQEASYVFGTTVTVADVPEAPKGYTFEGWTITDNTVTVSENGTFEMPKANVTIEGEFVQEDYWLEVVWEYVDGVYCGGEYKWDCDKLEYVYSSGAGWKTEPSIIFTVTNYGSKSVNLELTDKGQAWNKYLTASIATKTDTLGGNGASKQISFSGSDFAWNYEVLNVTALETALSSKAFVIDENMFELTVTEA